MENERVPLLGPLDHAELSSTRENGAGFLALPGSDASSPGDRRITMGYNRISEGATEGA